MSLQLKIAWNRLACSLIVLTAICYKSTDHLLAQTNVGKSCILKAENLSSVPEGKLWWLNNEVYSEVKGQLWPLLNSRLPLLKLSSTDEEVVQILKEENDLYLVTRFLKGLKLYKYQASNLQLIRDHKLDPRLNPKLLVVDTLVDSHRQGDQLYFLTNFSLINLSVKEFLQQGLKPNWTYSFTRERNKPVLRGIALGAIGNEIRAFASQNNDVSRTWETLVGMPGNVKNAPIFGLRSTVYFRSFGPQLPVESSEERSFTYSIFRGNQTEHILQMSNPRIKEKKFSDFILSVSTHAFKNNLWSAVFLSSGQMLLEKEGKTICQEKVIAPRGQAILFSEKGTSQKAIWFKGPMEPVLMTLIND